MDHNTAATPLLRHDPEPIVIRGPAPGPKTPPLSGLQRFAIRTFAVLRILRGLCFIIYPALSVDSLEMPESPSNTIILGCLLGGRDLLLGGLLITADESLEREVRRALVVNLLSDAMDTFILIFSAACSADWEHRLAEIIGVAVLALLEHLTLFSMGDDEELEMRMIARNQAAGFVPGGYQTMYLQNQDKKMRLESWLTELRFAEEEVRSAFESYPEHAA
ncbi:hypothetical protein HJFPF1_09344 [Paramyrothecium foliicola]|nr:hypothetical protein HJFPF1_09344 [Paramyrothecium foliicola]